jgi:hypothetical protein
MHQNINATERLVDRIANLGARLQFGDSGGDHRWTWSARSDNLIGQGL